MNRFNMLWQDEDGQEWVVLGAGVEEMAQQLPEDFSGNLTVRDEAGFVRGWIHSRLEWRAS